TTLAVSSGDSQSTAISTSFGTALVALVTDAGGNPVSGVTVNFTAPGSGASASLSAGSAVSDVSGLASVTATANAVAGGYNVTAASTGLTSVTFGLTNLDVVAPTVTLSTSAVSVGPGETFDVTATFSETVTGFALLDVLVNHGSAVALSGSGAVYTITIQPTGSGDVSVSIAAGVAQDSSGNGNLASGTISVQNSTVEETSQLIGQFMNTRATQLINNQPDLTGFLSGNVSGQGKGQFNLAVTRGQGTFDISTRPGSRVWTRLQGAISHEGTSDSAYVFGAIGSHFAINKNLLLGAMLQLDYLDQDDGAASIKGKGWLIGPYFVTKFPDQNLFVEGRLLYGQSANDVSPFGTYTDKVDTERFLALLKVSGSMLYGKTTLIPKAQITYTTDDQKAYRDSLGNLIPDLGVAWGQVELGLDFETPLETRRGNGALLLFGGISAIGSHVKNSGNAVTVSSNLEGGRARAELGLSYQFADQGVFQVETFYDGIGMSGYESYGLQVGLDLKF
ncbi:Ig-like domain-containing protein, partial [Pseudophaeobacter arcticus]|uniref:Ig-like domain-containing protein n=1 Tax=Pseudophaeobacter arcticus TaxID=385492 RepID=UPI0039E2AF18